MRGVFLIIAATAALSLVDQSAAIVGARVIWRSQLRCYYNVDQALLGKAADFGSELPESRIDLYTDQAITAEVVRQHFEKTGEELPETVLQEHEAEWSRFIAVVARKSASAEPIIAAGFQKLALSADSCKDFLKQRLIADKYLEKLATHGEEQRNQWLSEAKKRLQAKALLKNSVSP